MEAVEVYEPRGRDVSYNLKFAAKKGNLRPENTHFGATSI
jgi:hypothetical protein